MPWIPAAQHAEYLALQRDLREGRLVRVTPPSLFAPKGPKLATVPAPWQAAPVPRSEPTAELAPSVVLSPEILEALGQYTNGPRDYAASETMARASLLENVAESAIIDAIMTGPRRPV